MLGFARRMSIATSLCLANAGLAAAEPATASCPDIQAAGKGPALRFVKRIDLWAPAGPAPSELSGLAIQMAPDAPGGFWFWTLADGDSALYRVSRSGQMERKIDLGPEFAKNLEGISIAGQRLYAVRENPPAVVSVDIDDIAGAAKRVVSLGDMDHFKSAADPNDASAATLKRYVSKSDPNDMLEGIAIDAGHGRVFLLKEKHPALLIEASADLEKLRGITLLHCGKAKNCGGEAVLAGAAADADVSDIAYDKRRDKLWLLSDKLQSVFLYDPKTRGFSVAPLRTVDGQCVNKPEGVALLSGSDDKDTLFVINDNKDLGKTYIFEYAIEDDAGRR